MTTYFLFTQDATPNNTCPGYLARPFVKKASSLAFHAVS